MSLGPVMMDLVGTEISRTEQQLLENPLVGGVPTPRHPTFTQMEERTLLDANITYTSPDERWYLTAYGKNLLNEKYRVSANSVGGLWNFTMWSAPLQWGVEFGLNFN